MDYCLRREGHFRPLARTSITGEQGDYTGPPAAVWSPVLSGQSVAWLAEWEDHGTNVTARLYLRDLASGRAVRSGAMTDCSDHIPRISPVRVAPTGVAAWQLATCESPSPGVVPAHPVTIIQALRASTGRTTTLDDAPRGTLGHLQLYGCASGCLSGATIAAWTRDGRWHYARIT